MIRGLNPVIQSLLGTLFTWGLTALGAALVFVFRRGQRKVLDASLGFAAGVMIAASYWSLLAPAIEMAENSGFYGANGEYSFIPISIGFILGAAFVYFADIMLSKMGISSPVMNLALDAEPAKDKKSDGETWRNSEKNDNEPYKRIGATQPQKRKTSENVNELDNSYLEMGVDNPIPDNSQNIASWRRILLLIVAITIHNIPEGLAVGVGFGAIGKSSSATFENARNLAVGIGIQNFPEGLAVSLPLRGAGMSTLKSFWYGQLSGMVEPIAGFLGALAVTVAEPLLPYALAFAAGAMIYVVIDDIVPESQIAGNGKLASWGAVVGFVIMMSLDVGLG